MTIADACAWLEALPSSVFVRESLYGFPSIVGLHIFGLAWSVGLLAWVDLRLLGLAARRTPLAAMHRAVAPWFLVGFVVMFATGVVLFATYATAAYGNVYFRVKMLAIALAGANAVALNVALRRLSPAAAAAARPPRSVRLAGGVSLALWIVVILCGRMISYTIF